MVIAKYYDFDTAEVKETKIGDQSPIFTLRETYRSLAVAKSRAKRKWADIQSGTKTISLEIIGNGQITAEGVITTSVPQIAGKWIVKSASHRLDNGGFKTSIEGVQHD